MSIYVILWSPRLFKMWSSDINRTEFINIVFLAWSKLKLGLNEKLSDDQRSIHFWFRLQKLPEVFLSWWKLPRREGVFVLFGIASGYCDGIFVITRAIKIVLVNVSNRPLRKYYDSIESFKVLYTKMFILVRYALILRQ